MSRSSFRSPWISYAISFCGASFLYITSDSALMQFYAIPGDLNNPLYKLAVLTVTALVMFAGLAAFNRNKSRFDNKMHKYEAQLEELLKSKAKLQHKVHRYSDNADKLKLFISDRLLEYIEYDEKFLHFKNIASEVRHNGVICYDKVNTSLRKAMDQAGGSNDGYKDALESMEYLWDLLDLSTTDNIAMYIANKLYESEEHYYQKLLNEEGEAFPYSPTFSVQSASVKALKPFYQEGVVLPKLKQGERYTYSDDRFLIELDACGELLGNENYIVLLLENLVNNALFYTSSKKYSGKYSRIAIFLEQQAGQAVISVYNRGPLINDDIKSKIFQLGFSTKRVRENNGKGLGLYFVNEIVKGYEGDISVSNIENAEDIYVIKLELANGDEVSRTVKVLMNDKSKPVCVGVNNDENSDAAKFNFTEELVAINITRESTGKQLRFADLIQEDKPIFDPTHPGYPHWCFELSHTKRGKRLVFKPLNIEGVEFRVALPTADSRVEASYHDLEDDMLADVDELGKEFEKVSDYVQ